MATVNFGMVGRIHHTVGYRTPAGASGFDSLKGIQLLNKVELSFNIMWCWGITLVKLSFLFFYRCIFRGKGFAIANWTTIGLVISWGIAFFWVFLFMCHEHIAQIWNPLPPFLNPKCMSSVAILFANFLTSCFLDVVILIIPIPLIWQLKLDRKSKLALTGIFSIGGLCIAASTLRLVLYSSLWWAVISHDKHPTIFGLSGVDDFGMVSLALFWSLVELGVACSACCLPSLKPLLGSETLRNLPSTFSALSLHSIKSVFGGRAWSESSEAKAPYRQASEASWAPGTTSHGTIFGKEADARTYSTIEAGSMPEYGAVEAGRVLRSVEIGQTRIENSS